MPCYSPLKAYQGRGGNISFSPLPDSGRSIQLPCGQCIGCKLERSRQWAVRCVHESKMHESSVFGTFTYSGDLPPLASLEYRDFQLFLKRLRKRFSPRRIRFFVGGEYGGASRRPHFHACLFGLSLPDRRYWRKSSAGFSLYRSSILEELWPHGSVEVGDVTFESAAYIARYCLDKLSGVRVLVRDYGRIDLDTGEVLPSVPEFGHMSLKPGIGGSWFDQFYVSDVLHRDAVVIRGKEVNPPRYYDRRLAQVSPAAKSAVTFLKAARQEKAALRASDNTRARLKVKEAVVKAGLQFFHRDLK